jgi:hypothetical protein
VGSESTSKNFSSAKQIELPEGAHSHAGRPSAFQMPHLRQRAAQLTTQLKEALMMHCAA